MSRSDSNERQPEVARVFRTREQTRAFYDKISKVYDLLAERSEAPVRDRGLSMLDVRPGERVLEIGFGTGRCLVSIAQAVGPQGRVHGIDLSEGMLRQARERLEKDSLAARVELRQGDATHLPYDDGSMDAVFISFTLELFDTPEIPRVLSECRRVLVSGGRLGVVGMSKGDGQETMMRIFEWTHEHFPNFVDCRPIYVRRAVESAGFAVEVVETMRMWVPVEVVIATKPLATR